MKRLTLISKGEVPNDLVYLTNKNKIDEVVTKKLSEGIGEEVFKVLTSKKQEGKGIIEKTMTVTIKDFNIHKVKLVVVNEKELDKLEEENERLAEENEKLKETIKGFEAIGLMEVVEAMKKTEIVKEFLEELQELSEEFAERINE